MIMGATARMGMVCEAMIHGIRLLFRVLTWTMATARTTPRTVPMKKPTTVDDRVTQLWKTSDFGLVGATANTVCHSSAST